MSYRPVLYSSRNIDSDHYFEFEGDANLPIFWTTLFDEQCIRNLYPKLNHIEKLSEQQFEEYFEDENHDDDFSLMITLETFNTCTAQGFEYIQQFYPEYLSLYQQFIDYIRPANSEEYIYLNIFDFFQDTMRADETVNFLFSSIAPIHSGTAQTIHQPHEMLGYCNEQFFDLPATEQNDLAQYPEQNQQQTKYRRILNSIMSWTLSTIIGICGLLTWYCTKLNGFFHFTSLGFLFLTVVTFCLAIKYTN